MDGSAVRVAILIDYENIHWSMKENYGLLPSTERLIESLRQVGGQYGSVVLMQAYADFDNRDFYGLQSELQRRGVETRHVFSKSYVDGTRKNAADVEMSLDALELTYTRGEIDMFMLVCGDRDMIPLIKKLVSRAKQVEVVAVAKTLSRDLQDFVDSVHTIEELLGVEPSEVKNGLNRDIFIRRLQSLRDEAHMPYIVLKYFIGLFEKEGHDRQSVKDVINQAIREGLLRTRVVDNPDPAKREFPVTIVELNDGHEEVQRALQMTG